MGDDELAVMVALARRLNLGRESYGEWCAATDQRDHGRERHEELLDAAVYGAMRDVCRTIPAPHSVPDDRDTERGT